MIFNYIHLNKSSLKKNKISRNNQKNTNLIALLSTADFSHCDTIVLEYFF